MTIQLFTLHREPTIRNPDGENYTLSRVYRDGVFFCQCCEDEDRFLENGQTEKVHGRTAIPRGRYRLITSYSNRFQRVLPLVVDVPGFAGIRIHGGNTAADSLGCLLFGQVRTSRGIAQCATTVQRVIDAIDDAADLGIQTWLEIE